jgi:hypothetical protein
MNDLAEIRRFWPKATWWGKNMHAAANGLRGLLWIERVKAGLHRVVYVPENWGRKDFDGPTIAAAMAAAGFARRPKGGHSKRRAMLATSAKLHPMLPGKTRIPLESRQRPRKGVRLGKRGRRLALAASIAEALEMTKSSWPRYSDKKRLDRGEIGG